MCDDVVKVGGLRDSVVVRKVGVEPRPVIKDHFVPCCGSRVELVIAVGDD